MQRYCQKLAEISCGYLKLWLATERPKNKENAFSPPFIYCRRSLVNVVRTVRTLKGIAVALVPLYFLTLPCIFSSLFTIICTTFQHYHPVGYSACSLEETMNTLTRGNYFSGISLVPGRILRVMSHEHFQSHTRRDSDVCMD